MCAVLLILQFLVVSELYYHIVITVTQLFVIAYFFTLMLGIGTLLVKFSDVHKPYFCANMLIIMQSYHLMVLQEWKRNHENGALFCFHSVK